MKAPTRPGFHFVVVGGLDKPFYNRLRDLRQKYDLSDKGLIECMIWFTLAHHDACEADILGGETFGSIVDQYNVTAPSDMVLPVVLGYTPQEPVQEVSESVVE